MHVNKDEMCANVRENTRCEGVMFTLSSVIVYRYNCNKKEIRLHSDAYHHEELGDEGQYCHPVS